MLSKYVDNFGEDKFLDCSRFHLFMSSGVPGDVSERCENWKDAPKQFAFIKQRVRKSMNKLFDDCEKKVKRCNKEKMTLTATLVFSYVYFCYLKLYQYHCSLLFSYNSKKKYYKLDLDDDNFEKFMLIPVIPDRGDYTFLGFCEELLGLSP